MESKPRRHAVIDPKTTRRSCVAIVLAYLIPGLCHWTIFGTLHMPEYSIKNVAYVVILYSAVVGVYHAVLYVWSFIGPLPIPTYYVSVEQDLQRADTD